MTDYFLEQDDVQPIEMLDGVWRRTMGTTDEAMLCEFTLEQDAVVPEHSHVNDQVGYVISGKLRLTVAGEARDLHAGDSYAIPGGVVHSALAVEPSVIIDAFSPPRSDYRTEAR